MISTTQREGFTGLGCGGKAPPPKSVEVKDDSGQKENIFLTVALRGELPSGKQYCRSVSAVWLEDVRS